MDIPGFCESTMYCSECGQHYKGIHVKPIDLGKCHYCVDSYMAKEIPESEINDAITLEDVGDGKMIPICAECED